MNNRLSIAAQFLAGQISGGQPVDITACINNATQLITAERSATKVESIRLTDANIYATAVQAGFTAAQLGTLFVGEVPIPRLRKFVDLLTIGPTGP